MNIKALSQIISGFGTYQAGEFITMPDADALQCIKAGSAEPGDRRARRLVAEHSAADLAAQQLSATTRSATENRRTQTHQERQGFSEFLKARDANWHGSQQSRFS